MVQAASYPPLQKAQGRGTLCSGTGRENTKGRATRQRRRRRIVFLGVIMKKLLWTAALAVGGFALGWQDQGGRLEPQHVLLVTAWFAAIGFGFGSIFAKRRPRKGLFVFYWAFTLGL